MRNSVVWVALAAAMALSACASPDYRVATSDDLLQGPKQVETLGEMIQREGSSEGCLAPGNAGDTRDRCEALRDVIAPPPPPPAPSIAPPPLPAQSDDA